MSKVNTGAGGLGWLVTGGAGFVGSHLVDALLARGDRVVALDTLETGKLGNLSSAAANPRFQFIQGSVLDEGLVEPSIQSVDIVVHLAAVVGVERVVAQPLQTLTNNLHGTEAVVQSAQRHKRRLVIASSSEIYGKNPELPTPESADMVLGPPTMHRWSYALGKATDEALVYAFHRERGLDATVVRLFNTVGPRQTGRYGMVVPRFVAQALAGQPLTVYGTGQQTRCFCHVVDVVDAVIRLAEHQGAAGRPFNVGSTEEITIIELAQRIKKRLKSSVPIRKVPYPDAGPGSFEDVKRRMPDTSLIRDLTGWRPRRSLDVIIDDVACTMRALAPELQNTRSHVKPAP